MNSMALLTYGINHKSAALELREQLSFQTENIPMALQDLKTRYAVNEAVLLSTCNRTELYVDCADPNSVAKWLAEHRQVNTQHLNSHSYAHHDFNAIRHIMRVASGLDSMVLGEPQILGQMKEAYALAQQAGTVGPQFHKLFPSIFSTSKTIRTQTSIGAHPVSIAYAIVQLAKRIFSDLKNARVLLIGSGETIELAATHLFNNGIQSLTIANRSFERAQQLAQKYPAKIISLSDIPNQLKEVDLLITATSSPLPILGKGMVESALKSRKHRPILMADLAVPRDIEPEVGQLEDIYLYNIDDLNSVISQNLKSRESAAEEAENIISLQTAHYLQELRIHNASNLIQSYRKKMQQLSESELEKAMHQLHQQQDPERVLKELAHNICNKMMHQPTIKIREAAYEGDFDLLNYSKILLDLEPSEND